MSAKEKAGKKNPLSNAASTALHQGLQKCNITAKYKGPVVWNSLTKGKLSIFLPAGEKISPKEQLPDWNTAIMGVVTDNLEVNVEDLRALGVFDEHGVAVKTGECKAVFITKLSLKPGEDAERECWLEIQIGDAAVASFAKQGAKKTPSSSSSTTTTGTNKSNSKSKSDKKNPQRTETAASVGASDAMFAGWRPGKNTPAQSFAEELAEKLLSAPMKDKEQLSTYLEPLLTMFANQAYAKGYSAATCPSPAASVANLGNRL